MRGREGEMERGRGRRDGGEREERGEREGGLLGDEREESVGEENTGTTANYILYCTQFFVERKEMRR